MSKIKLGLIGVGWIGSEHGRNILANKKAELVGVADPDSKKIAIFFKNQNYECQHYSDYRDLLDAEVDAVVIASPNNMHATMCIDAAKKGKHIYCEKPMAITLDDCRRVRDAVTKYRVKYLIGYHRRLNPLYQFVRNLLNDGKLGNPFLIESDYIHHIPGDWDIWNWAGKAELAGSLFHAGSGHNVDLIRYFCGEIKSVTCFKDIFLPRTNQLETEDTAIAVFLFRNGAIGKVHFCVGPIVPFTFSFKLYGTKGTVINNKVWLDNIPLFYEPGHENDCLTLPASWIPDNVQGSISEPWNKLMDHFIDMLTDDVPCVNDVESAFRTSAACFAAMKAAEQKTVVDVTSLE
ncbi:MAG TPA: Gfo/Idh/MocA family oxidoreductase [bacterium]|nr:Gfo/Idh/MocA family oxidoreductase [bacterium]HOL49420.1 Gfo/Idh/MocA family oxidoreductase [bacterium]HPO52254.1 Gfo/Idh/MocA family oxidoreductase [bacterium]